jgi:hypothetical protein
LLPKARKPVDDDDLERCLMSLSGRSLKRIFSSIVFGVPTQALWGLASSPSLIIGLLYCVQGAITKPLSRELAAAFQNHSGARSIDNRSKVGGC